MCYLHRLLLILTLFLFSCSNESGGDNRADTTSAPDSSVPTEDNSAAVLPLYGFDSASTVDLPEQLTEMSGLAMAPDGSLYGHNDEQGVVYRIDPETGSILERFSLGRIRVEDDFEGIEVVGERFFLVNSKGELYEFRKGADQGHVEFTVIKTGLSGRYDVEGLCFDPTTNALLLACKEFPGKELLDKDQKSVYAFSLQEMKLETKPRFIIDAKGIRKALQLKDFKPSGIERHPVSGSFFILSSNDPAIIELSADGKLLATRRLSPLHAQPEGIAIDRSERLYIGNEGGKLVAIQTSKVNVQN